MYEHIPYFDADSEFHGTRLYCKFSIAGVTWNATMNVLQLRFRAKRAYLSVHIFGTIFLWALSAGKKAEKMALLWNFLYSLRPKRESSLSFAGLIYQNERRELSRWNSVLLRTPYISESDGLIASESGIII